MNSDTDLTNIISLEAIKREHQLLRALIDRLPDYIFVKDTNSRFILTNIAHIHKLGATSHDEIIGKTDFDTSPQDLAEKYYADEQRIIETGQPLIDFEEEALTADGQKQWLSTTKVPLFDEEGNVTGVLGVSRDITQRKAFEEQLHQVADDLTRSNAELEQFAYVASHDLQEPLRAITGYIQLIERRYTNDLGEDAINFIQRAVAAANRMKALIEALLSYSRVGKHRDYFTTVDCNAIVARAITSLDVAISESNAKITVDALPTLFVDPNQLEQLFQNLISNAVKFRNDDVPEVLIAAEQVADEWLFSVEDNGIGIEAEYAHQIFLIFQRLQPRNEYPGTGIGLALCKKIVENHGGRIWMESELDLGTTFFFTIPQKGTAPHV